MLLNFLISTVVTIAKLNFNWSWGKPYFCQTQLQLQLIRWRFSGKTLTRLGQVVVYIVYTICRFEILDVQVLHQQLFPTSAIYVYCSLKMEHIRYSPVSQHDKQWPHEVLNKMSKPNATKLNSTQSNSKSNFVRLDIILTWNPPHPPPRTNFSVFSRPARELKFGTDTHLANLIKIS